MGVEVDLRASGRLPILGLAALLVAAAALGKLAKLACAGGVLGRDVSRVAVAVGMLRFGGTG